MDTTQLSRLAAVLRQNGADVFSGTSKLTLSLDLLADLNASLSLIVDDRDVMNSSFHVINTSTSKVDTFRDMHFLHDFIQRSSSLKLSPPHSGERYASVAQFKNLRLLEIHNLNVDSVHGLQAVRARLQCLICSRCVNNMRCILAACAGDAQEGDGVRWEELKEISFASNRIAQIECLSLVPNLHTLDLSHNEIDDADCLNALISLKNLNLSYNKLGKVPEFSGTLCNRIQILVLSYNFIETIASISNLTNLRELDLSENCLVEHKVLVPIANLATLQSLNLSGNPMTYHPQHRPRSACYLHDNTSTVRFLLDGKLLSKSERKLVGSLHPRMRIRTTSNTSNTTPVEKPRRIRNVTITDNEYTPIIECEDRSDLSASSLITSGEHLDAKRQIEQLKQQYGDQWLKDQAGSLVQDVLGIERSPILSSTPYDSPFDGYQLDEEVDAEDATRTEEPKQEDQNQTTQPYVTALESLEQPAIYEAPDVRVDTPSDATESDEDLGDGEENIFLATYRGQEDSVFIVITETHILERESTRSKEKARWPIETLVSCESDEKSLTVRFDTLKNDAKTRCYDWDEDESPKLVAALRAIIDNQPAPESKLRVYKCLKCSTQFGVEEAKTLYDDNARQCPTCRSDLVFEDDT